MSNLVNGQNMPDVIPDHSILTWNIKVPTNTLHEDLLEHDSDTSSVLKRYKKENITGEFLSNSEIRLKVEDTIRNIEHKLEIDKNVTSAYEDFVVFIHQELDKVAGQKMSYKSKNNKSKSRYKPYWCDDLQRQWDVVVCSEKAWLKCKLPGLKKCLKQTFITERKSFDKLLRRLKRSYQLSEQQKLLDKCKNIDSRDFWKVIGKIGISNDRQGLIPWECVADEGVIRDQLNVLEKWKTDYESLYNSKNDMLFDDNHLAFIQNELSVSNNNTVSQYGIDCSDLNAPIRRDEVISAVNRSKCGKATGIDSLPAEALKNSHCIDILFSLFKFCFENHVIPDLWKKKYN
ncbi:hypothetical protein SNE40_014610 [Patella caerulea]|uniref:Uncharacterized protein n=1 Tax=Patella caerulea TaxID=87958 RepID=A0AAN8JLF1_PATCE